MRGKVRAKSWFLRLILALPLLAVVVGIASIGLQYRQNWLDSQLIAAIKRYDTRRAISLLSQGANANVTDTTTADASERPKTLAALWNELVGRLRSPPVRKQPGLSALMLACTRNRPHYSVYLSPAENKLVLALLSHGARANTIDENRLSALDYQVCAGSIETVKLLLDYGADLKGHGAFSPLMWAALTGQIDCAELLLARGADVAEVNTRDGATPLHYATISNTENMRILKMLVAHHASVNVQDHYGRTPLMCRCEQWPSVWPVRFLLDHGANVVIKDIDGETALTRCEKSAPSSPQKRAVIRLLTDAARARRR